MHKTGAHRIGGSRARLRIAVAVLLMAALAGCSSSNVCLRDTETVLRATLHSVRYDPAGERFVAERARVSLSAAGLGVDSMIVRAATVSDLALPLNPADTATSFVLTVLPADSAARPIVDTLTIRHSNRLEFISLECGAASTHTIRGVNHTTHAIDSVITERQEVNLDGLNNLKIYIHQ